jgi:hypothetical protein
MPEPPKSALASIDNANAAERRVALNTMFFINRETTLNILYKLSIKIGATKPKVSYQI